RVFICFSRLVPGTCSLYFLVEFKFQSPLY
ncbi:hypothetical protein Godav_019830, partial [Gossypium davidsonii]|nr:hypothetical protein [Gossypium davidsonii]MBA0642546.1 hypothetical protein [Gossypium klotzschianum]